MKKKVLSVLLAAALLCGLAEGGSLAEKKAFATEEVVRTETVQRFTERTGEEMIQDMGAGWNLGNTMDGHTGFTPGETVWQDVRTTKKLIKSVHDLGFNTVRIPVTWGTMIDDDNGYAIDEAWLGRVQDIVDYCMSQNMYAIINIHHDGAEQTGWLRIATEDQKGLERKFAGVWKNIATAFRGYDEHLIFESMNEVRGSGMTVLEENQAIMKLNQIFVDTVRATGLNNAKRWLMMPGKYNFIDSICNEKNGFKLPKDSVENRIMLSVHDYTPGNFCGKKSDTKSDSTYSIEKLAVNDKELQPLYDMYTSKGIPVIIGEYGCINKDNPVERAFYLEGMNRMFQKYKLVGVYWDQGWYDRSQKPDYSFAIIDRKAGKPIEKEVTDAILRGAFGSDADYTNVTKNTKVKPITELNVSAASVELAVNESKAIGVKTAPKDTNDIVLWKTENPEVATVAYGTICAKGIGTTKITAFSQSGSVSEEITVTVKPEQAAVACTEVRTDKTEYTLKTGESVFLNSALAPENTTETVYYQSSDEAVVTVSAIGKLVATGAGEAVVSVCTSGGKKAEVKIKVTQDVAAREVKLAVNVYYNDSTHNYYGNEVSSDVLAVTGNGQYTLSFDCDKDLSEKAKAAGVLNLNQVTAIYIKDNDVTTGKAVKTPLTACSICYDKIVVDGKELTLTGRTAKSALKASGIFDTNDPINSWDGNAVEEVTVSNNVASFTGMDNPKKISITFTLTDMCFEGSEPEPDITSKPEPTTSPEQPTVAPDNPKSGVKVGDTVTSAKGVYKVTKTGEKGRAVTFVKPAKKSLTAVVVPDTVKLKGKSYTVTAIAAKACKNYSTLKEATIGRNVAVIGKEAFCNCKKLKKITIRSSKLTLNKVGKKAFSGVDKKLSLKAPKKKVKSYKKILNKRS